MKKNIKEFLNKSKKILKDNILLVGLVLTGVLNDFILRALTVNNIFKIRPIITSIAMILIVSVLANLLSNKKRARMYIFFSIFFAILNAINFMYYLHFNSFLSIGLLNQSRHLSEMKSSVLKSIDIRVLLFAIPTLIFIFVYRKIKDSDNFNLYDGEHFIQRELLTPFLAGFSLLLLVSTTLTGVDISRLVKQWNREYLVEQFGIYTYTSADLIKSTSVPKPVKADYGEFDDQITALVKNNKQLDKDNAYTDTLEGKDLYVIHYESVQNFAMDLSFADGEVTPFLNKLANESLFFENFYPQHSVGTSSDSEFTFATSLYPINSRTVFIDHADKEFQSIQKLLKAKGYHTMSMHGNNGSFWNRDIMHPNIGYNEFLSKKDYIIDEEVGLGLSDMSFYRQSVAKIKERKESLDKPIMATLISLSNHHPFGDLDVYGDFDTGFLENTEVSNYLKSMNYADQALESFFSEMDKAGLLDNAAVLIYGDHHANISKRDYEHIYNYDEKTDTLRSNVDEDYISIDNAYLQQVRKTPLLIWTKDDGFQEKIEEPIAMINVMPTLANMYNIDNDYRMGQDIFNVTDNTIIFPNGSYLNKDYYFDASDLKVFDMETNELLFSKDEFSEELLEEIKKVDEELELSESIIQNDLTKYYQQFLKQK